MLKGYKCKRTKINVNYRLMKIHSYQLGITGLIMLVIHFIGYILALILYYGKGIEIPVIYLEWFIGIFSGGGLILVVSALIIDHINSKR